MPFSDILQPTHLLFILVVALLVLGPKRLPEVGRSLGRGLRDFRDAMSGEDRDRPDEMMMQTSAPGSFTSSESDVVLSPTSDAVTTPDSADHTLPVNEVVLTPETDAAIAPTHTETTTASNGEPAPATTDSATPTNGEVPASASTESATPAHEPAEHVG